MTQKLFLEALSKTPKRFIDDQTDFISLGNSIVMANPKYVPIIYRNGVWREIKADMQSLLKE